MDEENTQEHILNQEQKKALDALKTPKKRKAKKKVKRKSRAKRTLNRITKSGPVGQSDKETAGDSQEFRGPLKPSKVQEHSSANRSNKVAFTVYLKPKHAEWLVNFAALSNNTPEHLLDYLVRTGMRDDPTKGGKVGGGKSYQDNPRLTP